MKATDNLEWFKDFEIVAPDIMLDAELELKLKETCPYKPQKGYVPEYKFMMVNTNTRAVMGNISLRVGLTEKLKKFGGHIGYEVEEQYRGNNYAARSCRLLFPLLRELGINPVVITCDPDNLPSAKTIESLGAILIETKTVETEPDVFRLTSIYHLYRLEKIVIKPPKLNPGDKVATVSPSWGGPSIFPDRYQAGVNQLEAEFGLTVVEMPHTLTDAGWLARNPEARAADLMQAFSDPSIKGIITTIGGDDSIRLLPYIDLDVIRSNPKVFMGYSDATVGHMLCYKAGLVSFYGPTIMAGFAENGGLFPYMTKSVRRTLFQAEPIGVIEPNTSSWTVERLEWGEPENQEKKRALNPCTGWRFLQGNGICQGHLLGGCIEVFDWLRGTELWPSLDTWQDAILFLETSEEAPPPVNVKYMLRAFAALGVLKQLSGILFGRPGGGISPEQFDEYHQVILQVVRDEEGLDDLPIITNMDFGHTDPMFVLPYGVMAEIECDKRQLSILENAVTD